MEAEKPNLFQRPLSVTLLALLCAALWGSAATFIKLGYAVMRIAEDDAASQIFFGGCRFALAGLLTLLFASVPARRLPLPRGAASWRHVGVLALTQTFLQYLCFYVGVAHTSGTNVAIINGCGAFITILVAALVFRSERLDRFKALGCLLGVAAVLLMNLSGFSRGLRFSLQGEGLIFCAVLSYAFSTSLMKRYSAQDNPVMLSGWQFFLGGTAMAVLGLAMGGRLRLDSAAAAAILLYLACLSAVAYSLWGLLMKYNPVSRISVYSFANPIFGVLFSAALLGETEQAFRPVTLLALALVSLGIFIVNHFGGREPAKAAA
ncbi:MAG: DMT family transporter [Oscillospiraceae bacterium]